LPNKIFVISEDLYSLVHAPKPNYVMLHSDLTFRVRGSKKEDDGNGMS